MLRLDIRQHFATVPMSRSYFYALFVTIRLRRVDSEKIPVK